jgi:hypothetical protein
MFCPLKSFAAILHARVRCRWFSDWMFSMETGQNVFTVHVALLCGRVLGHHYDPSLVASDNNDIESTTVVGSLPR